ncbi:branched-chain amino acid ABC transporter permease [Paracoccus aerodenitrificans]|uniref:branched-chain amino acid ABC transporter permease n=1 Tax=Paracoccus aerodenitrificans TaxID=3017781 RepID=UPI0022F0814C|nr:branched-chain amino acid ABC transporter permease [Paracoccus aerodenitrificans]WBU64059.1 branched-chain amino acid ABC transporter permease [Paracoccus aerodenitrificans]
MTAFWVLQTLNALQYAALLFLISAGLSVSFGLMGFVNLAHGALYMLGAYIGISVSHMFGFWPALVLSPLATACIGAMLHLTLLRRVAKQGPMPQVLVSFGLVFIAVELVRILWGDIPLTLDPPALLSSGVALAGISYPAYRLFVIAMGAALATGLYLGITRTMLGAALRAATENPAAARSIGIRTERLFLGVFTLGAGLAGLGGVMAVPVVSASSSMAVTALIPALIVTVIGGMGSVTGAIAGALIVAVIEVFGAALWPDASAVLVYLVLAAVLILRPQGLLAGTRAA